MNLLGIAGSLRRASCNRRLLEAAAVRAPAGVRLAVYESLAAIPMFDEDLERDTGGGPPAVTELRQHVRDADGLVIATPEYNHSLPGVLKNAIDWLSRPYGASVLTGKPVAVLGASGGRWGTRLAQSALRGVLYATECPVLPAPALFVSEAERLFDDRGRLVDARIEALLVRLLAAFAAWIPRVSGIRAGEPL